MGEINKKMKQIFIKGQAIMMIVLTTLASCMSVPVQSNEQNLIYTFNEVPAASKKKFEIVETNWYWFGNSLGVNKSLDNLLKEEASKVPSSKGIKNLEIKVYNRTWYSTSWFPNLFGGGTSIIILALNAIGITNRSYYIKGEVF